jgi:uncharacterized protein YuzE
MRISVDRKMDVAYIRFQDEGDDDSGTPVETKQLSDDLLMDVSPDGTLVGIELLNASGQLGGGVEVEDQESGEVTRMSLPL